MSRTEPIPITTEHKDDPDMLVGETRTVEGQEGVRTYTWHEEFKGGISTGNKRYEGSEVTTEMQPTVIYEGTYEKRPWYQGRAKIRAPFSTMILIDVVDSNFNTLRATESTDIKIAGKFYQFSLMEYGDSSLVTYDPNITRELSRYNEEIVDIAFYDG